MQDKILEPGDEFPQIKVCWDPKTQDCLVLFKPDEFKQWPFVIAVLEMAIRKAEEQLKMQQILAARQAAAQEAHAQALAGKLRLG